MHPRLLHALADDGLAAGLDHARTHKKTSGIEVPVAQALFGKATDEAKTWYGKYAKKLKEEENGAESVLRSMAYHAQTRKLPATRRKDLATQRTFFKRNKAKMTYADFRRRGLPIGSGKVEGGCKYIVGKRFKGSGMRWKKQDNQKVLRARMAKINRYLETHYQPTPRSYTFLPEEKAA